MIEEDLTYEGVVVDDVWQWRRNDTTMLVTYADGSTRPYTPEEIVARNARLDAIATAAARAEFKAAFNALILDINNNITLVQGVIDATNASINSSPAASIKTNARAIKRTLQSLKDVARLVRD